MQDKKEIRWSPHKVSAQDRARIKNQKPCLIWLTGLSGSGKSTLANALESHLSMQGFHTYLLDGDNLRHGLNKDLGFSQQAREENIRRTGEVAKLFVDAGLIVIAALISPFRRDRLQVRNLFPASDFFEVYLSTPLAVCESRDPKGLYKKARAGELPEFTGISAPYEVPENPEFVFDTSKLSLEEMIAAIKEKIQGDAKT